MDPSAKEHAEVHTALSFESIATKEHPPSQHWTRQ